MTRQRTWGEDHVASLPRCTTKTGSWLALDGGPASTVAMIWLVRNVGAWGSLSRGYTAFVAVLGDALMVCNEENGAGPGEGREEEGAQPMVFARQPASGKDTLWAETLWGNRSNVLATEILPFPPATHTHTQ